MSWYRLICSNGLMTRVKLVDEAMVHTENAEIPDINKLVRDAIDSIETERLHHTREIQTRIDDSELRAWVDGVLKNRWGALAAARTYLICHKGFDGEFVDPFEKKTPSEKQMRRTKRVPGAPLQAENAYAVSQALAWIARSRLDVQEQMDYMKQIPHLIEALTGASA